MGHTSVSSLFLLILLSLPAQLLAAPKVMVSITPLAGLVAGVMQGVAEPQLLMSGGASPHSFALRPSQMRALAHADLVVWVGPELESFLERPLRDKEPGEVLQFSSLDRVRLLPAREGGSWADAADEEHGHHHDHDHGETDLHLWLDPNNARVLVAALATELSRIDPVHAESYRANAVRLDARIQELQLGLQERLAPLRETPYLVFHDAYQYFEAAFGLRPVGTLAVQPERNPGARRIREMRRIILEKEVVCIFSEPQFEPRLLTLLSEGTEVRVGELDPLGIDITAGPDSYQQLLQGMADSLQSCLKK